MGRTTPPPPLNITIVFPDLGRLARRAVRLHPRAGTPGLGDSSLGGPLLWPAGDPCPICQQSHDQLSEPPSSLVGVLQLYARDVPDLPFPDLTDLFQLLWCAGGRRMDHLLTVASDEFGTQGRWLPWEDREDPKITSERSIGDRDAWAPHGLMLGDVGSLYLFTCPVCAERPLAGTMQCSWPAPTALGERKAAGQ